MVRVPVTSKNQRSPQKSGNQHLYVNLATIFDGLSTLKKVCAWWGSPNGVRLQKYREGTHPSKKNYGALKKCRSTNMQILEQHWRGVAFQTPHDPGGGRSIVGRGYDRQNMVRVPNPSTKTMGPWRKSVLSLKCKSCNKFGWTWLMNDLIAGMQNSMCG